MNTDKLSPAPWNAEGLRVWHEGQTVSLIAMLKFETEVEHAEDDAEFIALARNAFDVLQRRPWTIKKWDDGRWGIAMNVGYHWPDHCLGMPNEWPDPFTALVAADEWYKEHVEKEKP